MATKAKTKKTTTVPPKTVSSKNASSRKTSKSKKSVNTGSVSGSSRLNAAKEKSTGNVTQSLKLRKMYIVASVVIVALGLLAYANRSLFVAATVNGQPISRVKVVKEAEKQSGKQSLENLIRNSLIEQEAEKANVTVTDKEIDDEIKKVETTLSKQGQKIDQVLELQGLTREDLRKLIRLDKIVGKIVGKDINVTDAQINDYIEKNQESLPQDQTEDQVKKSVSERLKQQELNTKVQKWLESLKSKAKIQYFVQY